MVGLSFLFPAKVNIVRINPHLATKETYEN